MITSISFLVFEKYFNIRRYESTVSYIKLEKTICAIGCLGLKKFGLKRKKDLHKGVLGIGIGIVLVLTIQGCSVSKLKTDKVADIEYEIVEMEQWPEEVAILIEENKDAPMKLSYIDQGKEYIVIGYGKQSSSGFSVEILEVYESENALYVETNLLGPKSDEETASLNTYPYIVIRIDENKKPIVYD